jgi:RNA polymerase sigma factor (sigma-70 family)
MTASLAISLRHPDPPAESCARLPVEVARLLAATPGPGAEDAWSAFVACYSGLLLRVATLFAPGYDGALDRYAYMLDELRRGECRRLRTFAADGRGRFSTWLAVVARRLCLDHYRHEHGRVRSRQAESAAGALARVSRRGLWRLDGDPQELDELPAPGTADSSHEVDERERREALRRTLAHLPASDQLLLRLRFQEDLTAREIATVLGFSSPFHVYRRLDAVYRLLRAGLDGSPGGVSTFQPTS